MIKYNPVPELLLTADIDIAAGQNLSTWNILFIIFVRYGNNRS
jgi:hypothetical protein